MVRSGRRGGAWYSADVSSEPDIVAKIREANELAATGRYRSIEELAEVVGLEASTLRDHKVSVSNYARLSTTGQAALSRFAQPAAAQPDGDDPAPADTPEMGTTQRAPASAPTPAGRSDIRESDTRRSPVARPETVAAQRRSRRNPISWFKPAKLKQRRSYLYDSPTAPADLSPAPTYSADKLAAMATDDNAGARQEAVSHRDCLPGMLATLAEDDVWYVREAVAEQSRCPPQALMLLAADSCWMVRRKVAERYDCPPQAAEVLLGDSHPGVREAAGRHGHRYNQAAARAAPDPAAADGDTGRLIRALSRPDCLTETLTEAAAHYLWYVRRDTARHPNCPPAALVMLGGDDHWSVRQIVAERDDCPPAALVMLGGDDHWSVRRIVAERDDCPPRTLARLVNDDHNAVRATASRTLTELRTAAEITALRAQRTSPNTPPATTDAAVRNPTTPHTAASRHTSRSDDDWGLLETGIAAAAFGVFD